MTGLMLRRAAAWSARRRSSKWTSIAVAAALLVSLLGGWDRGYDATVMTMSPGSVWLVSSNLHELTLLDTTTPAVARHLPMEMQAGSFFLRQGASALGIDGSTGALVRIDGRTATATVEHGVLPAPSAHPFVAETSTDLYVVDGSAGRAARLDSATLHRLAPLDLGLHPPDGGVAVDDTGRVWVTDTASPDVAWIAAGAVERRAHAVSAQGALIAVAADGPLLITPVSGTATQLDSDGQVMRSAHLPLRVDDRIAVAGEGRDVLDLVVSGRAALVHCAIDDPTTCSTSIALNTAADDLGRPVPQDGLVFVPDYGDGSVIVVDPAARHVVARAHVLSHPSAFEVFASDGFVVFNDPTGFEAGVVDDDGTVHLVDKRAPAATASGAPLDAIPPPAAPPSPASRPNSRTAGVPTTSAVLRPPPSSSPPALQAPTGPSPSPTALDLRPAVTAKQTRAVAPGATAASTTVAPSTTPVESPDGAAGCPHDSSGLSVVAPAVSAPGKRTGLTFCPIRINGGSLPITGPFELDGRVIGPASTRQDLLLVNYGDMNTCDAFGVAPPKGAFLSTDTNFDSADGAWSHTDPLGYPQAVTIARRYEFVTASPKSIEALRNDRRVWDDAHQGDDSNYPGILDPPNDVKVLATFPVPAGKFSGTVVPCKG